MRGRAGVLSGVLALSGCSLVTSLDTLKGAADAGADALPDAPVSPDSGCGDLQKDPKNCGVCGHDCLGGTCTNAACDPAPLASAQVAPGSIAVDAAHVYWIVNGSIQRTALATSGGVEAVGKGTLAGLGFLTVDGANLVAVAPNLSTSADVYTIASSEVSGTVAPSLTASFAGGAASAFGLDATHLFLFQTGAGVSGCGGGRCLIVSSRDGSSATKLWTSSVAADRVSVQGGRAFLLSGDTVSSIAPPEVSPTVLAKLPAAGGDIAADATQVYATVPSLGSIVGLPRGGGPVTTLAVTQATPRLLTAGAGWLAWLSDSGLMGCDPAACSPKFYAVSTSSSIALDARAIYWTEPKRAGVYRMPR